jgi:CheY-like chemotaxis protein
MMRLDDNTTQALGRVLLVEDDQSIRRLLRFSLWEAGFDIIEVVTGAEALETLENDVPEVVVLDLGLPDGLGGTVLLREAQYGWSYLPWTTAMWSSSMAPWGDTSWPSLSTPGNWS